MENTEFIFDEIKSSDMGLKIIRMDTGFVETPLFGGQDLIETDKSRNGVRGLYGVEMAPIEFTVELSLLEEEWTPERRYEIAEWLIQDKYKMFQTCDDLGKIYYAICIEFPSLSLLKKQGYGEATFRTSAPYAWTRESIEFFDLTDNSSTQIIEMHNKSNIVKYYEPKIEIEMRKTLAEKNLETIKREDLDRKVAIANTAVRTAEASNQTSTGSLWIAARKALKDVETAERVVKELGMIKLTNLSNGGKEFIFLDIRDNETISIDNQNKFIKTSGANENRFKDFNRSWLKLIRGKNQIEVTGRCIIEIKTQFPIVQ